MALILQVLGVVAPVFMLGGIGWFWARTGEPFPTSFVTRLSFTVSVPCLLFVNLARADLDASILADIVIGSAIAYVAAGIVLWVSLRLFGLDMRTFLAPLVFGNTGNVGIPVSLFAFGPDGLVVTMVIFAVMAAFSFTWGVWHVSGGGSPKEALKQPIFHGAILGLLFALMGWELPIWLDNGLELAGQMAIPLMLVTLGVSISRLSVGAIGRGIGLSLYRVVICGAAAFLGAWIAGLDQLQTYALIMQLIMPVAVTSYLMAERYEADAVEVAGLVVVSTLLAVIYIPLVLAFMLA